MNRHMGSQVYCAKWRRWPGTAAKVRARDQESGAKQGWNTLGSAGARLGTRQGQGRYSRDHSCRHVL